MPIADDVDGVEQAVDLEPAHRTGVRVGVEHVSPPACP
jgi:hypothetical protein